MKNVSVSKVAQFETSEFGDSINIDTNAQKDDIEEEYVWNLIAILISYSYTRSMKALLLPSKYQEIQLHGLSETKALYSFLI